jgi:hypothetical protein
MLLTPKLAAAGLASSLLLTGCSVNAPVGPFDIHDNTVNNPSVTIPEGSLNGDISIPDPIPPFDPNAPQDIPDSWSEDSVDEPDDVVLPQPIG